MIRVEWGYHQINRSRLPDGFRIYLGVGPQPDYSSPAASVPHVLARTAYVSDLIGLAPGAIYSIGVRAFNGSGEETNTVTSLAISDATGPDGVDSLMALPTATQGD
ncbi:MAG: hypothetical protein ABS79_01325 [Planctomycetes bacterium SCN 63-9]|nr:MAG: hypothetical protein ABS79_01325 [Planctomycetes bacterium SCN 63-9]